MTSGSGWAGTISYRSGQNSREAQRPTGPGVAPNRRDVLSTTLGDVLISGLDGDPLINSSAETTDPPATSSFPPARANQSITDALVYCHGPFRRLRAISMNS